MIFAEGEMSLPVVLGGIGSVVSALVAAWVLYANTRVKNQQASDTSALGPLREALRRADKDAQRRDAHIVALGEGMDQLYEEHMQSQIERAELYGHVVLLHNVLSRLASICKRHGEDVGELPEKPNKPTNRNNDAVEFRMRTLKQQTETLAKTTKSSPPIDPAGEKNPR